MDAVPPVQNLSHPGMNEESKGKKRKIEDLEEGDDDNNGDGSGGRKRNKMSTIMDAVPPVQNLSHPGMNEESKGKKRKIEDLEEGDDDNNGDGSGGRKRNKMSIEFLLN
ncbi:hypothetical protein Glove_309g103 [Diversispora epigaea]|uniref:Uncharacterized protein n=1 Tax=Diversispora epigaea TaxID=1348612 RepID=A0A397HSS2_9GLOM|nr:hypothetical protein Glove_309g103 [Diversispora epigaea]